jgi:dipeptidyl aminopeptidase/acylaminoacyl peptidase
MHRDIRDTPHYRAVQALFDRTLGQGLGRPSTFRDGRPSPDGTLVAARAEVLAEAVGLPGGRIVLAAIDGSGWSYATAGPGDACPRWSPDGSRLSFIATDDDGVGLRVLDPRAPDHVERLPALPGIVEDHAWSPDGTRLLALVAAPGAEQADALGSGRLGVEEGGPPWLPAVSSSDDDGSRGRSLHVIDVAAGTVAPAWPDGRSVWEADWCGDDAVVAIVSDNEGEEGWYDAELVRIDLADGSARTLRTTDVQLAWAHANRAGTCVTVVEAVCSDRLLVAGDLLLVDPASGATRSVATLGVDVSCVRWRDDRRLLATGLRGLRPVALDVDAVTGAVRELWTGAGLDTGTVPGTAPLGHGDAIVGTVCAWNRAPALALLEGGAERVLADADHPGWEAIRALGRRRSEVRWHAPDGLEIEGFLTLPPGEGPFATILTVHGGPVWAYQDWPPELYEVALVDAGYAVLAPNPRGSIGAGQAFAGLVVGDMGGADNDDYLSGLDRLVADGVTDPARIGITGVSYGGFMATWLPVCDPRFGAAVAISPVTDWYSEHFASNLGDWVGRFLDGEPSPGGQHWTRSPVLRPEAMRTPTLLTAGGLDEATPSGQAVEFHRRLRGRGIPSELAIYPEEGHDVHAYPARIDLAARALAWFERFLGGGA